MKIFDFFFLWACLLSPVVIFTVCLLGCFVIGVDVALWIILCVCVLTVVLSFIVLFRTPPPKKQPKKSKLINMDDVAEQINLIKDKKQLNGQDLITIFKCISENKPLPFAELDPFKSPEEHKTNK